MFYNVARILTQVEVDDAHVDLQPMVKRDLIRQVRHAVAEDTAVTVTTESEGMGGVRMHARTPHWRAVATELVKALRRAREGHHDDRTISLIVVVERLLAEYPNASEAESVPVTDSLPLDHPEVAAMRRVDGTEGES